MDERFLTLYLPDYVQAARFILVLDGSKNETYARMLQDIYSLVGNNKEKVDWGDPDTWIPENLDCESQDLAMRIWKESKQSVNPRWSRELWRFAESHALVKVNDGVLALKELGKRFVDADDAVISQIDEHEGVYLVLSALADRGSSSLNDLFGEFRAFFQMRTTWKSDASFRSALRYGLNNMRHRELVFRKGHKYEITDAGLAYLLKFIGSEDKSALAVQLAVKDRNGQARRQLGQYLQSMNPFHFEHLVARLFEAMGYENVYVTTYTQDQGVDIRADIEFGISSVHEIIQVKRHKGNIGQPTVTGLRGAMPLFGALRGSIVTTGGFSKGAQDIAVVHNAPPISLIDGERLLDLLIEHNIGIRKREIKVLEFDVESISELIPEDDLESASIDDESSSE